MRSKCIVPLFLAVAAMTAAAQESPLCETNRLLIETSLKVIAQDLQGVVRDEFDAAMDGRRAPIVAGPVRVASAWGQINASQLHMQALGCKPYAEPIDPGYYNEAVFACNRDKSRERKACERHTWERVKPASK